MPNLFYVHNYGPWHIVDNAQPKALCGAVPKSVDWNSRMKFRNHDPRLEADDRSVCGMCLLHVGALEKERESA